MNEIKCPHCGQAFTVDEAGFSAILSQVRTREFDQELEKRIAELKELLNKEHHQDTQLRVNRVEAEKNEEISRLTLEIEKLRGELENSDQQHALELEKSTSKKEMEIARLKQQLESFEGTHEAETKVEMTKALSEKNEEISRLTLDLERLRAELEHSSQQHALDLEKSSNEKDREIERLTLELQGQEKEKEFAIMTAVAKVKEEHDAQKVEYEAELKKQRELVEYYKDFKSKLSTKMVGESLERHCESEFRKIQGYFPPGRVAFDKDNEIVNNSKGDFIYREFDENGNELISIMFEMKNEMDTTTSKHKNEDFFKELDKDRRNKNCEYAVLVSLLEADNDFYNQGIVGISSYEKMYVVRPQCFLTIISILRSAAMNVMEYKQRIIELENQSVDITNFEQNLTSFKEGFLSSYSKAKNKFESAIDEIDTTIKHLENLKKDLLVTVKHLGTAGTKLNKLTVKQLTRNNPTMLAMFAELEVEHSDEE